MASLLAAGRSLVSALDPQTVLDRILTTACEVTGARYAAIGILDERRTSLEQFLTHGIDEQTREAIGELPRGRGVLGALIRDPQPLRLDDVSQHPQSYGFPEGHPEMHGFLGVPIVLRGAVWGNLYLTEKQGGAFTEQDEEAAVILADWAATAIENARLFQANEHRSAEQERALRSLEATRDIVAAGLPSRVLILTTFDLDEYVYDALRAGASGFLLKDTPASQLAAGVRVVANGDALLAPTITKRLIEEFAAAAPHAQPPPGLDELTPRELEVFRLVARGRSNPEIAADLFIAETTVKTHITRLLMKLGLRDRVQAVVLAYEAGIVSPSRRQAI